MQLKTKVRIKVIGGGTDELFIKTSAGKIILQDGTLLKPSEFNYDTYDVDNPPVAVVAFEREGRQAVRNWIVVARSGFLNNSTAKFIRSKDIQVFTLHAFDKPGESSEK